MRLASEESAKEAVVQENCLPCVRLGAAYGTKGGVWGTLLLTAPGHLKNQTLQDETGTLFSGMRWVFKSKGRLVLFFAEISCRDQAETLRGKTLYLPETALPGLEPGAFYAHRLLGCAVRLQSGALIGHISDTANFGAGDLAEIRLSSTGSCFFVPFREPFIHEIHWGQREVSVANDIVDLFGLPA